MCVVSAEEGGPSCVRNSWINLQQLPLLTFSPNKVVSLYFVNSRKGQMNEC